MYLLLPNHLTALSQWHIFGVCLYLNELVIENSVSTKPEQWTVRKAQSLNHHIFSEDWGATSWIHIGACSQRWHYDSRILVLMPHPFYFQSLQSFPKVAFFLPMHTLSLCHSYCPLPLDCPGSKSIHAPIPLLWYHSWFYSSSASPHFPTIMILFFFVDVKPNRCLFFLCSFC